MSKVTNSAKGITGQRKIKLRDIGLPENERDNFYNCGACGQPVDMRDLGQVFHHEENGHETIDLECVNNES